MEEQERIKEYKLLKELSKIQIKDLDKFLSNDQEEQFYSLNINIKENKPNYENKIVYEKGQLSSNNNIVNAMLNSKDLSTFNMGVLLSIIERQFPKYFNESLNVLSENIDNSNGIIKYIGRPFDTYTLQSTAILLRKILSFDLSIHVGKLILFNTIRGIDNRDFEFYSYTSLLKRYTTNKNQTRLNDVLEALNRCYEVPSTKEEALDNMRKLVILVETTGLTFHTCDEGAYYSPLENAIYYNKVYSSDSVLLHEFGHAIDNYFSTRDKTTKPKKEFNKAKQHIENNPKSLEIINKLQNRVHEMELIALSTYNSTIIEKYGSIENALDHLEQIIIKKMDSGKLSKLLDKYNITGDLKSDILIDYKYGDLDTKELAKIILNADRENHVNKYLYMKDESTITDILSAIYGSMNINIQGQEIHLVMGHSKDYYDSEPDKAMCEIIANLNSLVVLGKYDLLNDLKELIGEELFNYLMNERNNGRIIPKEQQSIEKKVA